MAAQPALAIEPKSEGQFVAKRVDLDTRDTEELVIGLCGPIGSPIHEVGEKLKEILENSFGYSCEIIKLSKVIQEKSGNSFDKQDGFTRIKNLIKSGNELREKYKPEILSEFAINQISLERAAEKDKNPRKIYESRRICYIVDSIKNDAELQVLRQVYRDLFYVFGIFSPLEVRRANLIGKGLTGPQVMELVDQDSGEELDYGQTVRDTFPQSDFFLRIDSGSDKQIDPKIKRYLNIIFGAEISTPSPNETAMYQAWSSAGNSACLSRQVGACITDKGGEILALGWNDVPKAGGGLYSFQPGDEDGAKDHRCMNLKGGTCFNDKEKNELIGSIADILVEKKVIPFDQRQKVQYAIQSSRIQNLIEFSRSIHAEMHAIILGSQKNGARMVGGKLFCTTYPCHSCARHIIVAGIKEVHYIEPYRKSLAIKLHEDDITENEAETNKVHIKMFDGVAPSRYMQFFKSAKDDRKKDGRKIKVNPHLVMPRAKISLESLPALEGIVVNNLIAKKAIVLQIAPAAT